jgi:hypothetical protein
LPIQVMTNLSSWKRQGLFMWPEFQILSWKPTIVTGFYDFLSPPRQMVQQYLQQVMVYFHIFTQPCVTYVAETSVTEEAI